MQHEVKNEVDLDRFRSHPWSCLWGPVSTMEGGGLLSAPAQELGFYIDTRQLERQSS